MIHLFSPDIVGTLDAATMKPNKDSGRAVDLIVAMASYHRGQTEAEALIRVIRLLASFIRKSVAAECNRS